MHIVFEFPIIDCRPLLPDGDGKLVIPEWPTPARSNKCFIRNFGAVKERKVVGSVDWAGEAFYCDAHLAMKYKDLHHQGFPIMPGVRPSIYNSYRRYYSDGYFVGKIEAGFIDNLEKVLNLSNGKVFIKDILAHYANFPVTINDEQVKLYRAGPLLARQYYRSSTIKKQIIVDHEQYVVAGEIVVALIYAANENIELPEHANLLDEIMMKEDKSSLKLYGYKHKESGYTIKVWIIELPIGRQLADQSSKDTLRNLRINLLRIHLEKETLRILLNKIKNNKIILENNSREAQLAKSYFKKTAEKLFKKERYFIAQKNFLDFALQSEETVSPDSSASLKEAIYYFDDQFTKDNIERILKDMIKKIILFICASPRDKNPLDFGNEFKQIKDSLQKGTDRYNYQIEIEASVRKSDFFNLLARYRPDYLHISMHASLREGLYFEDGQQEQSPMSVEDFKLIMGLYNKLAKPNVIILSACNSLPHANAVKDFCNHSIGTKEVFPADAGVVYAANFYSTLFENNSTQIEICHNAATLSIKMHNPEFALINNIPVYEIPVLI